MRCLGLDGLARSRLSLSPITAAGCVVAAEGALRSGRRRKAREYAATYDAVADVADTVVTREARSRFREALGKLPRKQPPRSCCGTAA